MLGHKLTLRVKVGEVRLGDLSASRGDGPQPPGVPYTHVESEVLLDGKKLSMVQKLCFMIDAKSLIPVVVLTMIPGEVEIEFDGPADVVKAMGSLKEAMFTLSTPVDAPQGLPPEVPPPLDLTRLAAVRKAWEEQFGEIPKCPQG